MNELEWTSEKKSKGVKEWEREWLSEKESDRVKREWMREEII